MNVTKEIKERFFKALEERTSWGRNDLKTLYSDIVIEVLAEKAEEPVVSPI